MRGSLLISTFIFLVSLVNAQDILPRGFAPGELAQMPAYIQSVVKSADANRSTDAPDQPIRSMAEWEELQAIVITWAGFQDILAEIVRASQEEVEVIIVCSSEAVVRGQLTQRNVPITDNISFVETTYNSIWVRDYGPNSAYLNDVDSLVLVDWIYNRPRYLDDQVPAAVADFMGVGLYETNTQPDDLVNTGGNYMSNGMGQAFSSELVLDENGPLNNYGTSNHSVEDVDRIMDDYLGVSEYVKMVVLPYDAIHHIDMHMKLLDERTLLVGEYPAGVADGPQIEANIQFSIQTIEAAFGRSFDIVWIPMPPDANGRYPDNFGDYRTYANALFVNKTILVPVYETQYDTTALRIWQETMPGYNIVGIDCNAIIPLSGALHCITKEIGVADPLLISHGRLDDISPGVNTDYAVEAIIKHRSGIQQAFVHYTTDPESGYNSVEMFADDDNDNTWVGYIPQQEERQYVHYYIEAIANNGKTQVRPIVAPEGYFKFFIKGGVTSTRDLFQNDLSVQLNPIYPNPASAITAIPIGILQATNIRLELWNILGQKVDVIFQGTMPEGQHNLFLHAQNYVPGHYQVRLISRTGHISQTLLIR
jgi:agmatine/peptidylarginine deiminase